MSIVDFSDWVGHCQETQECIGFSLVKRIAATLSEPAPKPGEPLPSLWHWAFFQEPIEQRKLGPDGHPALGGFLPPAHNRNRMWAGSRLTFHRPLEVESNVTCISTILSIEEKLGRTGSLLFVTVGHEYFRAGQLSLREEQDIVYRDPVPPRLGGTESMGESEWNEEVTPSSTLLFRYSAVTFNAHRVHYDWPYVTGDEGYPGLVVHGPLIATLNLRAFTRAHPKAKIKSFSFRGVRPLIAPQPFGVAGRVLEAGRAQVWAGTLDGAAQIGEVEFVNGETL